MILASAPVVVQSLRAMVLAAAMTISAFCLLPSAFPQDVLTIGTGTGQQGGSVSVPVFVRDVSGTTLGIDAGGGKRVQGIAFKVFFPTDTIASVSIARAGVMALATPMYEANLQGPGWSSFIASFNESTNAIPLISNQAAPGNQVAVLTVTLQATAGIGVTAALRFDAPSATLSNQAGTFRENVANAALALANGSVTVAAGAPPAAPSALIATATSTSNVDGAWSAAAVHHYEIWRSFNGSAYALIGTSLSPSFSDLNVTGSTAYLYRVRGADAAGGVSTFSNIDVATTVMFTNEPLGVNTTAIELLHFSELRTAVNAVRVSAKLAAMANDSTLAAGSPVLAQHVVDLRNAIAQARSAAGLPAATFAESMTGGSTLVKASHVEEIRAAVR